MNLPQYLQNFVNKYNGKRIDVDNQFGYQCWDLSQIYAQEVWGVDYYLSCRITGGVKDIYNDFERVMDTNDFTRYPNLLETVPNVGDFVIWGYGQYGHIAIVLEADVNTFTVLEQNGGQGDGDGLNGDEVKITKYQNYIGVLGFITPKEKVEDTTAPTTQPQTNMSYPSNETYSKLEKATNPEHTKYIRDAVNNLDLNLLVNDYADRVNERKQEKAELEKTKEELNRLASTSIAKTDENLKSDKVISQEVKTPQNEIVEVENSTNKPFWKSKKFVSLISILPAVPIFINYLPPEYEIPATAIYSGFVALYNLYQGNIDAIQAKTEFLKIQQIIKK